MIISNDVNQVYLKILELISTEGKIKGKRRETIFLTFTLFDVNKNVLFFPFAQRNWPWILREASDRIFNVKNPGLSYKYSKNWENRIEPSGLYSYHYANRLDKQMDEVLSKKIHSRDKIISVWEKSDYNLEGRQPCTIIMQPIMEDDNKMSLVVYMRNNDVINILPSDIFIHSTYFKYWATKKGIEYKNLYWVAGVAYYQKKRDVLEFPQRLIRDWKDDYTKITPTRWNQEIISDLESKENIESNFINLDASLNSISNLKTDYVKEWTKIMLLHKLKREKNSILRDILSEDWKTEFKIIRDSLFSKIGYD